MRRYGTVLLLLALSLVILSSYGTSAIIFDPGNFTRMGQNIDLFQLRVNKSPSVGKADLNAIELNYTGTNTTPIASLITNMTVWNTTAKDNLYGHNTSPEAWQSSGSGYLFNVSKLSNKAGEINTNATNIRFNLTLEPGPTGDGSTLNFTVNKLYGPDVEPAFESLPWPVLDRIVWVDESPPNVSITDPVRSANLSGTVLLNATVTNHTVNGQDSGVNRSAVQYAFDNASLGSVFNASGSPGWTPLPHFGVNTHNTTFAVDGLQDGEYRLRVRANDTVDIGEPNVNDTVWSNVTVDNTNPGLTPRLPVDGANISGQFFVNATRSDALTGVENASFNVTQAGTLQFAAPLNNTVDSATLTDGTYNLSYNAVDFAANNNSSVDARTVTIDNTPPRFWNNQTNSTAASEAIEHRVYVNDSTELDSYIFSFDNGTGSFTNDSVTSFPVSAAANWTNISKSLNSTVGLQIRWRVWANDTLGNEGFSQTFSYTTTDEQPPIWKNQTQNTSRIPPGEAVELEAFGRDETNLSHAVLVTNETGTFENKTGNYSSPQQLYTADVWTQAGFTWDNDTFTSGTVGWRVRFNDTAGNWNATNTATFVVDSTPPTITIHNPPNASIADASPFLNVTADESTDAWRYEQDSNGTNISFTPNTTLATFADGQHNVTVWTNDTVGNWNRSVRAFTVDNTPPTITPQRPGDGANVSGNFTVNATWRDATTNATAMYNLTNATSGVWKAGSLNASVNSTTLADGLYNISYNATDFAGNTNASVHARTITVDNTPPQFARNATNHTIVSPYAWTNQTNATLTATVTDVRGVNNTTTGVHALNLSIEKGGNMLPVNLSVTGSNGAVNLSLFGLATNLSHGVLYNATAAASDLLGNRNRSMNWSFRTDFNPPRNVSINDSFGSPAYNGWFLGERTVQIDACFEPGNESGVDAAAVLLNGVYRAWNTSFPRNVTLNKSGEHAYTFACRDVAGNVNRSFNETYKIDVRSPGVTPVDPSQDETGVSTSFTFNASLQDESQESFLNVSASNLTLFKKPSALDVSTITFTNSSVTADVSGLNEDTIYTIRVTAEDNVGHTVQKNVTFSTQSSSDGGGDDDGGSSGGSSGGGGGGTTVSGSLDITTAPSSVAVTAGRSTTFSVTVANDGDTSLSGVDLGIDAPTGFALTGSPADVSMDAGDQQTVDAELSVDAGTAANIYAVTLDATADDGTTATQTLDVTVEEPRPNLTLVNPPREINVPVGENITTRFTVRNRGTARAARVVPGFIVPVVNRYIGGRFGVDAGRSKRVTVNLTTRNSAHVGVYSGTFTVTHPSKNLSHPVTVKVQPGTEAEKEEISRDVNRLQDRFDQVQHQLPANESEAVRRLLEEASTAAGEGDYATAAERREEIRQRLEGVGGGQNIILPAVVAAAIIVLLGVLFFFFPPREMLRELLRRMRKEDGYQPRSRGMQRRASLREKMEKSRTDLLRESFETAVESAKEKRRRKEEEEERGYQYRG